MGRLLGGGGGEGEAKGMLAPPPLSNYTGGGGAGPRLPTPMYLFIFIYLFYFIFSFITFFDGGMDTPPREITLKFNIYSRFCKRLALNLRISVDSKFLPIPPYLQSSSHLPATCPLENDFLHNA